MAFFELACVAIIGATLAMMIRDAGLARLRAYASLAVAGWIGEETCIRFYEFYAYSADWHLFIDRVPILVPLIWPLVILSARDVVAALAPSLGTLSRALAVGSIVAFDAALVEVIAVAAGLWSWAEPGHLGVPLIGILGWGFFAAAATAVTRARWGEALAIVAAPLATHAAICASWWLLFRWTLRGALGNGSLALLAAASALFTAFVLRARHHGRRLTLATSAPRLLATALFASLLFQPSVFAAALALCAGLAAVPYILAVLPERAQDRR